MHPVLVILERGFVWVSLFRLAANLACCTIIGAKHPERAVLKKSSEVTEEKKTLFSCSSTHQHGHKTHAHTRFYFIV